MSEDLQDQLNTILVQVDRVPAYFWTSGVPPGTVKLPDAAEPGARTLYSEQLMLLEALYERLDESRRGQMIELLPKMCYREEARAVVVHFLAGMKRFDVLLDMIAAKPGIGESVLAVLARRLENEPHSFAQEDFSSVGRLVDTFVKNAVEKGDDPRTSSRYIVLIGSAISRIRYLRLREELLEGRNPEINADQEVVIDRASRLGFSKPIAAALREIEAKLRVASSGFDFKACVDLTRTTLEEVMEESSKAIATKYGTPAPSGAKVSHHAPYLQYLSNAGLVLKDEHEALQKLYNLLSNEGAHSLEAAKEQAYVYRAVTVEWLLLITGRVQAYLK